MKAIHLLRKPCSEGTVAANVLKHGVGGLNVDGCRVGTGSDVSAVHATRRSDYPQSHVGNGAGWGRTRGGYAGDEVHWEPKGGRWPANLVLQHLDGCVQDGVKKVKVIGATEHRKEHDTKGLMGWEGQPHTGFRDPDGTETVTAWACAEGCPVASLPFTVTNPGTLQSDASNGRHISIAPIRRHGTGLSSGNSGGASRFFKQVKP